MAANPLRPGNVGTEERLNQGLLIGRLVAVLRRGAAQSISSTGANAGANYPNDALEWDAVELDELGGWSGLAPTRYTAVVAGWYEFSGGISFGQATSGSRRGGRWYLNGTPAAGGGVQIITSSTVANALASIPMRTTPMALDEGDFVELVAMQSSGSALATSSTLAVVPRISVRYVALP